MELNDWLAITGALRDWKLSAGVHILCKPQNARKENASADSAENENERKQVDWLEKRIVQCTAKSVERTALVSRSIMVFVIFYIHNRYASQQQQIEIDRLKKELIDIKYDALTRSSELMEKSRQSRIEEYISNKESDLQTSTNPPYLIK